MNWTDLKRRLAFWKSPVPFQPKPTWARVSVRLEEPAQFAPEWEDQLSFDAALSRALRSEPVPAGLRETILREGPQSPAGRSNTPRPLRWVAATCARLAARAFAQLRRLFHRS